MQYIRLSLFVSLTMLAGCQVAPPSLSPVSTPVAAPAANAVSPAAQAATQRGNLNLVIQWPARSNPNWTTQAIPVSTQLVKLTVKNGAGEVVGTTGVFRGTGTAPVSNASLDLPVGTGYTLIADAYEGISTSTTRVATATKANVDIAWNQNTSTSITLDPLFAPQISSISDVNGGTGKVLTLGGSNFDRGQTVASASVLFPGAAAGTVVEVPATLVGGALQVAIPAGAGTGTLRVKADGILSSTGVDFARLASLSFTAPGGRLESDDAIHTWLGDSFALTPTALDANGASVTGPRTSGWAGTFEGVGGVNASGSFSPLSLGYTDVTLSSGTLTGARRVYVSPAYGAPSVLGNDPTDTRDQLSLAKLGTGYLAAWYAPLGVAVNYRLVNADGTAAGSLGTISATARNAYELQPRIASRATEAMMAYRKGDEGFGVIHLTAFGTDGGVLGQYTVDTGESKVFLGELVSNGSTYLLGYYVDDGAGSYWYKTQVLSYASNTVTKVGSPISVTGNYPVASYQTDKVGLGLHGSDYVIAAAYGQTQDGSNLRLVRFTDAATVSADADLSADTRVRKDVAIASNGQKIMVAALDTLRNELIVTFYTISGSSFSPVQVGGSFVADTLGLSQGAFVTGKYPISATWNGTEFAISYTKSQSVTLNGATKTVLQPMVCKVSSLMENVGTYPIAGEGTCVSLQPTSEGGIVAFKNGAGTIVTRRLKLH